MIEGLAPRIRYVVFADSDAGPRPHWLRAAVARLDVDGAAAVTGYRWFLPERPSWANHILYSVNCGIMSLMGRRSHYLLWGGPWALRRDTLETIGLDEAWHGTLSDDLVASRVLRRARAAVWFEPACIVASPMDYSLRDMFAFLRRQYLVVRYYGRCYGGRWPFCSAQRRIWPCWRPPSWWASRLGRAARRWRSWSRPRCCSMGWASVIAGWCRTWYTRIFPGGRRPSARRGFDIWLGPVAGIVNFLALASSVFGRHICWRRSSYRMLRAEASPRPHVWRVDRAGRKRP